jgi:hypothetical protein
VSRVDKICARCAHFGIKDDPARAAQGIGRCGGYDGAARDLEPWVAWDHKHCVLFRRAADMKPRERWIGHQQKATTTGEDAHDKG